MNKILEPIIFFGSGPVAAESLRLLAGSFNIEYVVTKPQPPHHREPFPVLLAAQELGLPLKTAQHKTELTQLIKNFRFKSRVAVLVDFGIIVEQQVIDAFPLGIINAHFSILPQWRGADPITFSILSGQESTGVSLMLLVKALDEGPLIAYAEHPITKSATTPSLTQELILLSHQLLVTHLPIYIQNRSTFDQSLTKRDISYSRKLNKSDGLIDWQKPAQQLEREIRAFIEWPKSHAKLAGKDVIVVQATPINAKGIPGSVNVTDRELVVYCEEGALQINKLKPAGKQEMTGEAFIAGYAAGLASDSSSSASTGFAK